MLKPERIEKFQPAQEKVVLHAAFCTHRLRLLFIRDMLGE